MRLATHLSRNWSESLSSLSTMRCPCGVKTQASYAMCILLSTVFSAQM